MRQQISGQFFDHTRMLWRVGLLALVVGLVGIFTLPVLDRDEARFAQASAQMVESGDLINIRYLDEARNKKPVGIYWMQAASAFVTGADESRVIWPYRIPSVLGAILTAILTAMASTALFGRVAGLVSGLTIGVSVLLGTEAGIAKTDAMLAASCAAAFYAFVQLRLETENRHRLWALIWWGAIGLGTLLKGPVTPMVAGLAVLALFLVERDFRFLWRFADWPGPVLAAIIVLPWFTVIQVSTGGAFLSDGLGGDLAPKLVSGHESHGAPPGVHLALLSLLIFPGILLLPAGLHAAVRQVRNGDALPVILVACFAIPGWIVFEIMPTKLPHYALPAYPALAGLIGLGFVRWRQVSALARWLGMILFGAVATGYSIAFGLVTRLYGSDNWLTLAASAVLIWCALMAIFYGLKHQRVAMVSMLIATGLVWHIGARALVGPGASELHLSQRAIEVIAPLLDDAPAFSSYTEPSLAFLSGGAFMLTDPSSLADQGPQAPALYVLDAQRWLEGANESDRQSRVDFLNGLVEMACINESVDGFNYSRGAQTHLIIIKTGCVSDDA